MGNKKTDEWEKAVVFLLNLDGWDLEWTGGGGCVYDAKGKTPKGKTCVLEIKFRKKHYNDGMMLEKKKYDALIAESEKHLDIPVYVNSTPDGVYLWSLYLIKPKWETNYLNPATTQFGNRNRVPKEVTYLCIKDAIKLL